MPTGRRLLTGRRFYLQVSGLFRTFASNPHIEVFLIAMKPFVRVRTGGFFIMRGSNVVANRCGNNRRKTLND